LNDPENNKPAEPVFYTIPEVAAILKRPEISVRRLVMCNLLPGYRAGRKLFVRDRELNQFIASLNTGK